MIAGKHRFNIIVTGLAIGAAMGGCSSRDAAFRADVGRADVAGAGGALALAGGHQPDQAKSYAEKARAALDAGKAAEAVQLAERAVAFDPRSGGWRALLGQAYMQNGRYSAAATALGEAAELGAVNGDAVVALALAKIAGGDTHGAVEWLSNNRDGLTASDLGLALSLAGDHDGALYVLGHAVRQPDATVQTRQNYALALALGGRWAQARLMAAQDLPLHRVEKRMLEFSALASAPDKRMQVASLMGTKLRSDAGMPVQLALRNFPVEQGAGVMMALADAPEVADAVDVPDAAPVSADVLMAVFEPKAAAPVRAAPNVGPWSVQVGALDSAAKAKLAWHDLSASSQVAARYAASTHATRVGTRVYYRLTLDGFSSQQEAQQLCATLRAERKDCFVRQSHEHADVLWAVRAQTRQLAMR